jgi:hypothetical protein
MAPEEYEIPLEPSYYIIMKNPSHDYTRRVRVGRLI